MRSRVLLLLLYKSGLCYLHLKIENFDQYKNILPGQESTLNHYGPPKLLLCPFKCVQLHASIHSMKYIYMNLDNPKSQTGWLVPLVPAIREEFPRV